MVEARVVDTNVVSFFLKRLPPPDLSFYRPHLLGYGLVISFVTVAELHRWAILHRWGSQRIASLVAYMTSEVAIYHSDDAHCRRWARLTSDLRAAGIGISEGDAWIAATALELGAPLVTHNRRHFVAVPGLQVISAEPGHSGQ